MILRSLLIAASPYRHICSGMPLLSGSFAKNNLQIKAFGCLDEAPLLYHRTAITSAQCGPMLLYWTAFCPEAGRKMCFLKTAFSMNIHKNTYIHAPDTHIYTRTLSGSPVLEIRVSRYARMHVYIYKYKYLHTHVHTHTNIHTHFPEIRRASRGTHCDTHTHTRIYTYTHLRAHTFKHTYIHTHIFRELDERVGVHTHIHVHTHTHIYT